MTEQQAVVRVLRQERTVVIQPHGRATARQSPAVRRFAEQSLADGATAVRFDLRHCTHMDSTFLGTLLSLKRRAEDRGGELALIAPSAESLRILQQMGIQRLFETVSEAEAPSSGAWHELEGEPDDMHPFVFKRNVVEAHQELAQLTGPVGEQYRALAEHVARELDAEQGKGEP